MALDIGKGDEVIVPDMTWIGSVTPVSWLGAKPIFVDVLEESLTIDPIKIEKAITKKTKAIIVVHPYGNVAKMDEIIAIGKKYKIDIIEDAAEAIGSEYKNQKVGSIGDFGVISLHGTKTLTSGEGGAILCNRKDLVDKITIIESQGRNPSRKKDFWVDQIGLKYKMSNIQAALGLAQFERADDLIKKKIQIFNWYKKYLKILSDIVLNPNPEWSKNSYWLPTIIFGKSWNFNLEKRNNLLDKLNQKDISLRPIFYPVSSFPMYKDCPGNIVSQNIYKRGINLPSYFEMSEDDIKYVTASLKKELRV